MIKVYNMDVLKALKQLPDESVDMQITSPPYWGLRDYGEGTESIWDGDKTCEHDFEEVTTKQPNMSGGKGHLQDGNVGSFAVDYNKRETKSNFCSKCGSWKGQLGLEPDFDLFIKHLCDIFDEVKRVLKNDGTCWVNLGDTYSGGNLGVGQPKDWKSISTDNRGAGFDTEQMKDFVKQRKKMDYSAKCLCAIPERFMIEMINRGWVLRNKIIWHKPNHMPTSVKDRFANSWEYLFMFSKSKKYYFDLDAVREPHKADSFKRALRGTSGEDKSSLEPMHGYKRPFSPHGILDERALNPKGKNPGDIIEDRTQYLISKLYEIKKDIRDEKISYKGKSKDLSQYNNALANAKAFRSGLKILEQQEKLSEDELRFLKDYVQNHLGNPKGKNPDDVISEPHHPKGDPTINSMRLPPQANEPNAFHPLGKNPSDYWDITTHGYPEAHFAVFPEALVEKPIKTTRKDAVIMDILAGSGTTLAVARKHNRDSIGIEIKKEYCDLIFKRLYKGNIPLDKEEFKLIK